jgi:hypothetical protein
MFSGLWFAISTTSCRGVVFFPIWITKHRHCQWVLSDTKRTLETWTCNPLTRKLVRSPSFCSSLFFTFGFCNSIGRRSPVPFGFIRRVARENFPTSPSKGILSSLIDMSRVFFPSWAMCTMVYGYLLKTNSSSNLHAVSLCAVFLEGNPCLYMKKKHQTQYICYMPWLCLLLKCGFLRFVCLTVGSLSDFKSRPNPRCIEIIDHVVTEFRHTAATLATDLCWIVNVHLEDGASIWTFVKMGPKLLQKVHISWIKLIFKFIISYFRLTFFLFL